MGYGFPIDFSVRASNDTKTFLHIVDQHCSNYIPVVTRSFPTSVQAQYFQVVPITYGTDEYGKKVFQLAEIFVETP